MAKYNFTALGSSIIMERIPIDNDCEPKTITFQKLSLVNANGKIKFFEAGSYYTALLFNDFGLIGGVAPESLTNAQVLILNLSGSTPEIEYNFDMTSDNWASIVDANSLKSYLESQSGESGVVVDDFDLTEGRLRCNLSLIEYVIMQSISIVELKKCTIEGLLSLDIRGNLLSEFNPIAPLPDSLISLFVFGNQLTDFNPSIALPENLQELNIRNNFFTNFNPEIALPVSLQAINLDYCQITTVGYEESEPFANLQPNGTAQIVFTGNPDSPIGTDFESILTEKGYDIIY